MRIHFIIRHSTATLRAVLLPNRLQLGIISLIYFLELCRIIVTQTARFRKAVANILTIKHLCLCQETTDVVCKRPVYAMVPANGL